MLTASLAHADEGMWMIYRLDSTTHRLMTDLGLQLSPDQLYNTYGSSLKDAVIDFADYCSGVVVSPSGLIFTNHHCGYQSIQQLSTPEDDILTNGFVAKSQQQERPVPGLFVRFLERNIDLTDRVNAAMQHTSNLDSVLTAIEGEYARQLPDRHCLLKSYYGASQFHLSVYRVYNDVRLVFCCPESLGKFGGETDNWMWPRQTSDFSVFRVYARPDGQPANYAADNVPLSTPRYAPVSTDGYQPGDFCMTIGYPGSTSRYLSSRGVDLRVNAANVSLIDVRGKKQEVWRRWMSAHRDVGIKYASKYASSSNYWKNSIGMNRAVANLHVIEEKQVLEEAIREWYSADSALTQRFGTMFDELAQAYDSVFEPTRALGFFNETFMRGIELQRAAQMTLDGDTLRLPDFYKDYDARVDEETMATLLHNYRTQVPPQYLPPCYAEIDSVFGGDCAAYARHLFASTDSAATLTYARGITAKQAEIKELIAPWQTVIIRNERLLTQAILEREMDQPHYSDANFSMRLSYGYVQDYTAGGTRYDYYTNAPSLLAKAAMQDSIADYTLADNIRSLLRAKNYGRYADKRTGDLQLCFLTNNDITGGNSGSPMFNGKGELLGLAFDGNWEAMSGDLLFDPDLQRCIGVDIRFVLFLIDKWGKADNIIKELGL